MDLQKILNKARELKKKGEKVEALKLYSQAFDILSKEAQEYAHNSKESYEDIEENGESIRRILPEWFDKAKEYLKRDKTAAVISNNMATILGELGDYEGARKMFEQAVELTPDGENYPNPRLGLEELKK